MTFPTISSASIRTELVNTFNHTGTVPSGLIGDLIIAAWVMDGNTTLFWPGAFQSLSPLTNSGGDGSMEARYLIATGTASFDFMTFTPASESGDLLIYRISDWHGTTPPEAGTPATGSSTAPDPPTVSPSWGADDNLYIVVSGWGNSIANLSAYPADYILSQLTDSATSGNIAGAFIAGRNLNASSDDPGAATLSQTSTWVINTLVVRPAASVGGIVHPIFEDHDIGGVLFGGQVVH